MQREVVERRRWIGQARFLHALNYCMLLPGPEATQLAIYIGWLLHRTAGGIAAGVLFVLPSFFVLWGLSFIYAVYGNLPWIVGIFYGLKPTVTAIVIAAVIRIGRKALTNEAMWALAALAFVAIYFFHVPFPLIILAAGLIGLAGGFWRPERFDFVSRGDAKDGAPSLVSDEADSPAHTRPSWLRAIKVTASCLALWWTPIGLAGVWLGKESTLFREGIFFSKSAVVTFGGAYAVLPYVAQRAVEQYQWLSTGQMMDGLGLAETTPGPLIMVLEFVGFMGGWNQPGALHPLVAATVCAMLTTWVTFTPCFLWVFLGAPHVEQFRRMRRLTSALSAVTAAVVGVILNLAVWFAIRIIHPASDVFDWFALGLGLVTLFGLARWKWNVAPVVLGGALIGLIWGRLK